MAQQQLPLDLESPKEGKEKKTNHRELKKSTSEQLKRLDKHPELKEALLSHCRLRYGEVWEDSVNGHRIGVLDATEKSDVQTILAGELAQLAINDPPYNVVVGNANTDNLFKMGIPGYLEFSKRWVSNTNAIMDSDSHFYVWMGADYRDGFQPFPDFILLMREYEQLQSRNLITLRNQRGYGTQQNWMWVRQELLHYTRGNPEFNVVYTDIPKVLKGYYKTVNGKRVENLQRSKSDTIRPSNVWIDIQQVFYRMEENVPGCYAQKPLPAIERIIQTSSQPRDLVVDFFAHSGTTLLAGELHNRRVVTFDIDPIFAEITIRRLEHFRQTGKTGWQWRTPFPEADLTSISS